MVDAVSEVTGDRGRGRALFRVCCIPMARGWHGRSSFVECLRFVGSGSGTSRERWRRRTASVMVCLFS